MMTSTGTRPPTLVPIAAWWTVRGGIARRRWRRVAVSLTALGVMACSPTGTEGGLPPNVQNPAAVRTPAGAMAFYRGIVASLPGPFDGFVVETGVFTDELAALPLPTLLSGGFTNLDSRQAPGQLQQDYYTAFHRLRGQSQEARGFLVTYAADSSTALRGHLYALEGYAEIFLADLYCSGIPLSTVDFGGDYTLVSGSTTAEVYGHAAALLDSAVALSSDSVQVQRLAVVGRGRALLGAGRYAEAAAAVAAIPDDFIYQVTKPTAGLLALYAQGYAGSIATGTGNGTPSMADREGLNGLAYRSSGDPRTGFVLLGQDQGGNDMYLPAKYPLDGPVTLTVASGVEARLIEAEAALQAGSGEWLSKLNALRTDGTFDTAPNPDDPSRTDTLWHAGGGGVAGLRPLDDPGLDGEGRNTQREDLLFRERAFWLYLTGHRQGDLRRLVREYLRSPEVVYPTGTYPGGNGAYGSEVVAPVPDSERRLNPKYAGCFNLDA